ncbi:MAG: zinc dependent phospholipase C family protein [Planctomycetota bacterium]
MNRFQRFLQSHHCSEVHQFLVLEAIGRIRSSPGRRLMPWLLRYHRDLLRGVLDPDHRFRDFHNHVLHVTEGFWGGAPRVAHQWYDRLESKLAEERFPDVAHAAGVLCHYLIDVINPLHTINQEREAQIHYAFEISLQVNLRRIQNRATELAIHTPIRLSTHRAWLGSLMMHASKLAYRRSASLINGFDLGKGLHDPESALDHAAIDSLAELFELTVTTMVSVLERAAEQFESEFGYPIPKCHWRWGWAPAIWHIPGSLFSKLFSTRARYARLIEMEEELIRRGRLVESLPAEVDIKQRVHAVYHAERRRALVRRKTDRPRRRAG